MPSLQSNWSANCCLDTSYASFLLYIRLSCFTHLEYLPPQTCLTESSILSLFHPSSTSMKHSLTTPVFINFIFIYNLIVPTIYLIPLTTHTPWFLTPNAVP